MALGAYDITPLEIAGAYTVFANQGDLREAQLHLAGALADGELDLYQNKPETAAGARSARGLPDDQPDGGGAAPRHRRGRARAPRLQRAGRRQDRHFARRLVRRLHLRAAVRGVGGLRRQPRAGSGRRALGRAHLGASS